MNEPPWLFSFRNFLCSLIDQSNNNNTTRYLKQIHAQILVSPDLPKRHRFFLITRLLFVCSVSQSTCRRRYAAEIFDQIENPNLFVYNAMIRAQSSKFHSGTEASYGAGSLLLYKQMLENGIRPDNLTFPFVVKECTQKVDSEVGRSIHGHIFKCGFEGDVFVQNSVISFYSVCGRLDCAQNVFYEMSNRSVASWNSLVIGYLRGGELDLALELFRMMKERDIITWNSIITGFVQGGRPKEALGFFHEMLVLDEDSARPDKRTVASVLSACASIGALDQGKWVHSYLKRNGLEIDMVISTALVDLYGKCGSVENAVVVFKEMQNKDVLAWTAMISGFALHGLAKEAFDLFEEMEMEGTKPNPVTFVGLLSACAHSGLVEKGRWCFNIMTKVYSIKPQVEHYACMVDLLGRAGIFDEAEELIRSMPMEPDVFVWGALLGSCRMHGNMKLGERIACYLIELEPQNHAFYVILSDIYAKANRFGDAKRIRASMEEKGIKKTAPGCSMIEINGIVHEFSVRRCPETMMKEIEWVLNGVSDEMIMVGNMPSLYKEPLVART